MSLALSSRVRLVTPSGSRYLIINSITRFLDYVSTAGVVSFGDELDYFNFADFKIN
jgi:hypothetical protein